MFILIMAPEAQRLFLISLGIFLQVFESCFHRTAQSTFIQTSWFHEMFLEPMTLRTHYPENVLVCFKIWLNIVTKKENAHKKKQCILLFYMWHGSGKLVKGESMPLNRPYALTDVAWMGIIWFSKNHVRSHLQLVSTAALRFPLVGESLVTMRWKSNFSIYGNKWFCLLLYFQNQEKCLAQRRGSRNIC